jgi:hypothetical protein
MIHMRVLFLTIVYREGPLNMRKKELKGLLWRLQFSSLYLWIFTFGVFFSFWSSIKKLLTFHNSHETSSRPELKYSSSGRKCIIFSIYHDFESISINVSHVLSHNIWFWYFIHSLSMSNFLKRFSYISKNLWFIIFIQKKLLSFNEWACNRYYQKLA